MDIPKEVKGFYDETGNLKSWPAKFSKQQVVIKMLSEHFDAGSEYNETDVNEILNAHHAFRDPALLRRELVNQGCLDRSQDGRKYWKKQTDK